MSKKIERYTTDVLTRLLNELLIEAKHLYEDVNCHMPVKNFFCNEEKAVKEAIEIINKYNNLIDHLKEFTECSNCGESTNLELIQYCKSCKTETEIII